MQGGAGGGGEVVVDDPDAQAGGFGGDNAVRGLVETAASGSSTSSPSCWPASASNRQSPPRGTS
nr:hypothetical protein [Lentzea guizhouensis]